GTALISTLQNSSFENGDFTKWTTSSTFRPGGQFFSTPEVVGAGVTAGFGFFATAPTDGNFAAFEGFDGDGPGMARIAQDIDILNDRSATLEFDYRAAWDMLDFPGSTKARTFMVDIEPFGGGTPLRSIPVLMALPGTKNLDTGDVHFIVDVS